MASLKMVIAFVAVALFASVNCEGSKKDKRGVALFNPGGGFDYLRGGPSFAAPVPWMNPVPAFAGGNFWNPPVSADFALGQIQLQATHNVALQALKNPHNPGTLGIAYPPEVVRAVHEAKEANHNVLVAQHRVADAKQLALLQQKIALAKEAAAREAAQRSEEITASAHADARFSTSQLVALQQKLATLKDALAAAQRVAAARESAAAAAIQRNAADTAAELKKQDVDKQISQSEQEAKEKDLVAAKEIAIANSLQHAQIIKPGAYHIWG